MEIMSEDIARKIIELYDKIDTLEKRIKELELINEEHKMENGELRKTLQMWKDNAEYWNNRSNTLDKLLQIETKNK